MLRRGHELVCQEMVELITDYLEGKLSRSQRRRFEAHLAGCEHCSEYLAQMRGSLAEDAGGVRGDLPALARGSRVAAPSPPRAALASRILWRAPEG
jgi:anti-sigma factor RsiW